MSTKPTQKGIRYTDAQKKEVADFVTSYNAANGRGGQSKAAKKFKVSQLTIATWLKNAGASPKKAAVNGVKKATKKTAKKTSKKAAKKAGKKGSAGKRYSDEQKKEIVAFANDYNAANGRGGQSKAAAKYGVSPLTLMAWLKASGSPKAGKKITGAKPAKKAGKKAGKKASKKTGKKLGRPAKSSGVNGIASKLSSLLSLSNIISKAEAELASLQAKFHALKSSL